MLNLTLRNNLNNLLLSTTVEWQRAHEQEVKNDTNTPEVALILDLFLEHLRCAELRSIDATAHLMHNLNCLRPGVLIVDQLNFELVLRRKEDVRATDVLVHHSLFVEVVNSREELTDDVCSGLLAVTTVAPEHTVNCIPEILANLVVTNEIKAEFIFKELNVSADVRVVKGADKSNFLDEVAEILHVSLGHFLDNALGTGLSVDSEACLALVWVTDHGMNLVDVVDRFARLPNCEGLHLLSSCAALIVTACTACSRAATLGPISQKLLEIGHGEFDDVDLARDTLAHHFLGVVLEDLGEVVRHDDLLRGEYPHLLDVRHILILNYLCLGTLLWPSN